MLGREREKEREGEGEGERERERCVFAPDHREGNRTELGKDGKGQNMKLIT